MAFAQNAALVDVASRSWSVSMPNLRAIFSSPLEVVLGPKAGARDKMLFAIGAAAIVWYFISITWVASASLTPTSATKTTQTNSQQTESMQQAQDDNALIQFMSFSVTTISGTLATYMGMVLGFGQVAEQPGRLQNPPTVLQITTLQKAAAWFYFGSLIYALLFWSIAYHFGYRTDPVIENLGRSVLGLFGGALAVILNVDRPVLPNGQNQPAAVPAAPVQGVGGP
jgi:hypothetical protein